MRQLPLVVIGAVLAIPVLILGVYGGVTLVRAQNQSEAAVERQAQREREAPRVSTRVVVDEFDDTTTSICYLTNVAPTLGSPLQIALTVQAAGRTIHPTTKGGQEIHISFDGVAGTLDAPPMFLLDGKKVVFDGMPPIQRDEWAGWTVTRAWLAKVANASAVKFRLGHRDYELSPDQIDGLASWMTDPNVKIGG